MAREPRRRNRPAKEEQTPFQKFWGWVRKQFDSVADLRFNVVLLAAGVLLVCVVPQGRDVIGTISDSWAPGGTGILQWWLFVVAVAFLGLQAWLWSRLQIVLRHGQANAARRGLLGHLPRVLGVVPYGAAAFSLWRVPEGIHTGLQALFLLALGALAYALYWFRFRVAAFLKSWDWARYWFQDEVRFGLPRFELGVLGVSLALSGLTLLWLAVDPVTMPMAIGSAALAFTAFALILPPINVFIALARKSRFPVLTTLLLFAVVSSCWNDNHRVRALDDAALPDRPQFDEAYGQWLAQAPHDPNNPGVVPVVLVSAAGGASRAGLWTLAALQQLDEANPDFHRSIFAVSAVSGSALGAIDYVASIAADETGDAARRRELAWDHAGRDFLAPAIGGMLYTDLIQRFIPFRLFDDRAWSIERGFEDEWARSCRALNRPASCEDLLRGSFLALWGGDRATWRPNLLLIGTVQEDGRRIITSNVNLNSSIPTPRGPWIRPLLPNTYDHFHVTGYQLRASTAVMNAARFPWISPAGRLVSRSGEARGHIIDGGYFEASAADTSYDLAAALADAERRLCRRQRRPCLTLRPIFLTHLNDEMIDTGGSVAEDRCDPTTARTFADGRIVPAERLLPHLPRRRTAANDLLGPLRGLFSTQGSRAELTLARMVRLDSAAPVPRGCVETDSGEGNELPPIEVRLLPCRSVSDRPMAMSWALSRPTRERMRALLAPLRLTPAPGPWTPGTPLCRYALQLEVSRLAAAIGIRDPAPPP